MDLNIFSKIDRSGKMSKENYVFTNFPEEYDAIQKFSSDRSILNLPFKERLYLFLNGIDKVPMCENPNCSNRVRFKNTSIGYLRFCSTTCVGNDPSVRKKKEDTSYRKFGTKIPSQSDKVKNLIISTNQERYGGNSPQSDAKIREKTKKTFIDKFGVDNPNKVKEISSKRIESFKKSSYKETYKNTSLKRYGTEHPWKNKDIHKKTIDYFYKDYRDRINSMINSDVSFIDFEKNISTNLKFQCHKCNSDFKILPYQFYYRIMNMCSLCTKCYPIGDSNSISQSDLFDFIRKNYTGIILENAKDIISPYEIDIYIPELKLGIEFNGTYWHSSRFKNKEYHLNKYNASIENNITLITIWEDDWKVKNDVCKSFILNKLGGSKKIGARKCIIKSVSYKDSRDFLNKNHLQGDCKSSVRLGLYYNDEIVSLMTFSKLRLPLGGKSQNGVYELTRFCNKSGYVIMGGASRLLGYFLDTQMPLRIETYSDNLISDGGLYRNLGFTNISISRPGYWYVIDGIRYHRFNWRKSKLVSMGFDKNKTEEEIMSEMGYYRIYNCGNKKWILDI